MAQKIQISIIFFSTFIFLTTCQTTIKDEDNTVKDGADAVQLENTQIEKKVISEQIQNETNKPLAQKDGKTSWISNLGVALKKWFLRWLGLVFILLIIISFALSSWLSYLIVKNDTFKSNKYSREHRRLLKMS